MPEPEFLLFLIPPVMEEDLAKKAAMNIVDMMLVTMVKELSLIS